MKITYKGFMAEYSFMSEAGVFCGEVINSADLITFQATHLEAVMETFCLAIDQYLKKAPLTPSILRD